MVGGVLVERTVKDVVPALVNNRYSTLYTTVHCTVQYTLYTTVHSTLQYTVQYTLHYFSLYSTVHTVQYNTHSSVH